MKVAILCGGYGTRIRDVADDVPKPMIPVGDLPILWHIMKYYSCWGHNEFVLCLGHKGKVIKDFFMNYQAHTKDFTISLDSRKAVVYHTEHEETNWQVTLAETGLHAMTGARVKRVQRYLSGEENFMLTYGDGLSDVNIDRLIDFHKSHGKIMTVTGVRPPARFGELNVDRDGRALEFNEKPQAGAGRISGGFFVCRRELFDYLSDDEGLVFELEPMRNLVRDKQMMVYEHDGFWQPMDTYRDYQFLQAYFAKGNAPWVIW